MIPLYFRIQTHLDYRLLPNTMVFYSLVMMGNLKLKDYSLVKLLVVML